jgi:D-tagatose-1,6-bisphosphate aldolase subunit GatZ/KbaZ
MRQVRADYASTTELLLAMVDANRRGRGVGIPSICSANRFVLEAAMLQAARDETVLLLESTCNQVNQFGGYTGMDPAAFRSFVAKIAAARGFPPDAVILGGDHLGPYPWRDEPAASAMAKARDLVRGCVQAGYSKIHLDCSTRLGDDPGAPGGRLDDEAATARTAELAAVAEAAHAKLPGRAPAPVYVIGTEVPAPGGEQAARAGPAVTRAADVERTVAQSRAAFETRGLGGAWKRVIALVVQPGVEFGEAQVFDYERGAARPLSQCIEHLPRLVFEAHSTDYQTPAALHALVEDHFAVLKVGPALTFALRETVFALAAIEEELYGGGGGGGGELTGPAPAPPTQAPGTGSAAMVPSSVRRVLRHAMLERPEHWQAYHSGDERELRLAREFSYSDRMRYYWPQPAVADALDRLLANLSRRPIPLTLLSQFLPDEYRAVREGALEARPVDLIHHRILAALDPYAAACGMR